MASLRKRGDKWQVQIRRHGQLAISKTFSQREDAIQWGREQDRLIDRDEWAAAPKAAQGTTLLAVLIRYEREITPRKRSSAAEKYLLRSISRHAIAKTLFRKLTPLSICEYRDHRIKQVSGSTVVREMSLLSHVINTAMHEWSIPLNANPVANVGKPMVGCARERRLTEAEALALQEALSGCQNAIVPEVVRFALATGMRRSEVLSLDWKEVSLHTRVAALPITKNGEPRRVPLSDDAVKVLDRLRQTSDKPPRKGKMFPISANAFRLSWERIKRRAKLEDLRFHDLRHEAISRFFELGLTVPEVKLISGHKDVRMLFRYTHLKAEDIAKRLNLSDFNQ